ncbi:MAG: hypothetical protein QNJ47_08240 [Nostocaceae cyanobacterium]|nr:hypothetical protein [Nostocaceae cyanobacterium]
MAKTYNFFPHDDSHPGQLTSTDIVLRQQLEHSMGKCFYSACDRSIQKLLSSCRWYFTTNADTMTLVIECPNQVINWRVLQKIVPMGSWLNQFITSAKIRICPPEGVPFEMRVDEISVYRDLA